VFRHLANKLQKCDLILIEAISATVGVLTAAGTVRAELWSASAGSNTFTPTGVFVLLAPPFGPGVVVPGTSAFNTAAAALPVAAGDKLLMVFSLDTTATVLDTLTGFSSAGVAIS
jgi:hypothetical protein